MKRFLVISESDLLKIKAEVAKLAGSDRAMWMIRNMQDSQPLESFLDHPMVKKGMAGEKYEGPNEVFAAFNTFALSVARE